MTASSLAGGLGQFRGAYWLGLLAWRLRVLGCPQCLLTLPQHVNDVRRRNLIEGLLFWAFNIVG
jgi:hypothetical protein